MAGFVLKILLFFLKIRPGISEKSFLLKYSNKICSKTFSPSPTTPMST